MQICMLPDLLVDINQCWCSDVNEDAIWELYQHYYYLSVMVVIEKILGPLKWLKLKRISSFLVPTILIFFFVCYFLVCDKSY